MAWGVCAAQRWLCWLCEIVSHHVVNVVPKVRDKIKCGECKLCGCLRKQAADCRRLWEYSQVWSIMYLFCSCNFSLLVCYWPSSSDLQSKQAVSAKMLHQEHLGLVQTTKELFIFVSSSSKRKWLWDTDILSLWVSLPSLCIVFSLSF